MLLFFTADNRCRYFATLKPQLKDNILQCDEEVYNMEFCANLGHLR